MADWSLNKGERQESSFGLAVRGTANAKGAYVQLIAATTFQYNALQIQLVADGGGGQTFLVDIAVGAAAAEVVIVPNVLLDSARGIGQVTVDIEIPISIPAGTRLSASCQEAGGAGTRNVVVTVIGKNGGANYPSSFAPVVNYGAITASTNGVLVDPGATPNVYGAWAEITAATSRGHSGIAAVLGTNKQTGTLTDSTYYFQIAIGAAGSEVPICEFMSSTSSAVNRMQINSLCAQFSIPSGTRIAMRSKCVSSGAAGARNPTAVILGY